MAVDKNPAGRSTLATVVATAAVTLAIGVTTAALGGYLVPAADGDNTKVAQPSEPLVVETPPAPQTVPPSVVLVPIAADGTREPSPTPPAAQEPEALFAVYDRAERDDDGPRRRGVHEREEHDDHDDDD